jgi:type I restriction enzyme R subunit
MFEQTFKNIDDILRKDAGADSELDYIGQTSWIMFLRYLDVRADKAKIHLNSYNPAQQEFLNFVLDQYVKEGVEELDDTKLPDLLELKYKALADAKRQLGEIKSIRNTFIGFQEYLYREEAG